MQGYGCDVVGIFDDCEIGAPISGKQYNSYSKRMPFNWADRSNMNAQRKCQFTTAEFVVLLVMLLCVRFTRQYRQLNLDRALIMAIAKDDADAILVNLSSTKMSLNGIINQ